jgi:hypothetical protein
MMRPLYALRAPSIHIWSVMFGSSGGTKCESTSVFTPAASATRRAEARAELAALLKLSAERYVPPYNVAMIYNGLGERDETLAWLERAVEQRDPRMTSLKVEPKWNNLRADPRFQDLLRRVGFTP